MEPEHPRAGGFVLLMLMLLILLLILGAIDAWSKDQEYDQDQEQEGAKAAAPTASGRSVVTHTQLSLIRQCDLRGPRKRISRDLTCDWEVPRRPRGSG
jgi:hypothetical protein